MNQVMTQKVLQQETATYPRRGGVAGPRGIIALCVIRMTLMGDRRDATAFGVLLMRTH